MESFRTRLVTIPIVFFCCLFFNLPASAETILPESLVIRDDFMPGAGEPIGTVQKTKGEVALVHSGETQGWRVEENHPLFENDTIITGENGRIQFVLVDRSVVIVSSSSQLTLTKSLFDEQLGRRDSLLNLTIGKIRCIVRKAMNFDHTEFKVKTRTAILGVRGSDFVVVAVLPFTRVVALDDTILEVTSISFPGEATVVRRFEQTFVRGGEHPEPVSQVPPEHIPILKDEFPVAQAGDKVADAGAPRYRSYSIPVQPQGDDPGAAARMEYAIKIQTADAFSQKPETRTTRITTPIYQAFRRADTSPASEHKDSGPLNVYVTVSDWSKPFSETQEEKGVVMTRPETHEEAVEIKKADITADTRIDNEVQTAQEERRIIIEKHIPEPLQSGESPWFPDAPD